VPPRLDVEITTRFQSQITPIRSNLMKYRALIKEGKTAAAAEIMRKDPAIRLLIRGLKAKNAPALQQLATHLTENRKRITRIEKSDLSSSAKKKQIEQIEKLRIKQARRGLELIDKFRGEK